MAYPMDPRSDLLSGNQQEREGITEFEYHITVHDQVRVQVDYSKLDIAHVRTLTFCSLGQRISVHTLYACSYLITFP